MGNAQWVLHVPKVGISRLRFGLRAVLSSDAAAPGLSYCLEREGPAVRRWGRRSRHPQRAHQLPRVALRPLAGREAGHGVGEDVGPRQPQRIHRPRRHDQRVRGIQPARHADDDLLDPRGGQALHQPVHLDVVRLVAVLRQPGGIGGHEREALDPAARGASGDRGLGSEQVHRLAGLLAPDRAAKLVEYEELARQVHPAGSDQDHSRVLAAGAG